MKYTLSLKNDIFYSEESVKKYNELGFEFKIHYDNIDECDIYLQKTYPSIEINTLEELQNFISKYGRILIDAHNIIICNE